MRRKWEEEMGLIDRLITASWIFIGIGAGLIVLGLLALL